MPRHVALDKALRRALEAGQIHSMVLWGPPGCGKTTLALLVARYANADFRAFTPPKGADVIGDLPVIETQPLKN